MRYWELFDSGRRGMARILDMQKMKYYYEKRILALSEKKQANY